ncbi:MAG TPA: PaaI family thioesterase [Thermoplasmata archaeon]|nr:PaaI family thioesterase [Thermoplasmata archaeon]
MSVFQDHYPDELAQCYGCGRLNKHGLHLRSAWEGEESAARFVPRPYHMAVPGFVNGGLLASLIDCHGTGTAAAAAYRAEGREMGTAPTHRFVTASLKVDYLRPTPLGPELVIRGRVRSLAGRKAVIDATIAAAGIVTVRGEVVAVELPDTMRPPAPPR